MMGILEQLSGLLHANPVIALGAAFTWGIFSVILSPCHIAGIPLIIAFISGENQQPIGKALRLSIVLAGGVLLSIGLIGVITAGMGKVIGDMGSWVNYLVASLFLVIGLHLVGVMEFSWESPIHQLFTRRGYGSALLAGLILGMALGPCTFAYMAPILGIVLSVSGNQATWGLLLLLFFALGHCSLIIFAGVAAQKVQKYLEWSRASQAVEIMRRSSGMLLLFGCMYFLYTA